MQVRFQDILFQNLSQVCITHLADIELVNFIFFFIYF